MIDWPQELIESIARRRCVIMIGSGVSRNSTNAEGRRPATWEGFLRAQLSKFTDDGLVESLIDRKDFLSACEIIKEKITADAFADSVQDEYQNAGYRPADIHKHIYNLDASVVATPNFDRIYDSYATTVSDGTVIVRSHASNDIANYLYGGKYRLLLKTHGTADEPTNIIFTRRDYAEARTKYVLFYEILKSLALTHTFLFIGCGVDDPDVRMLFEDIQFAHGRFPHHFMTLPSGENHVDILRICTRDMRIRFLEYSGDDGHSELTRSVEELADLVERYRSDQLCETQRW
ncbi:SIR2-like domain-containing protein [Sulfitobacter brevis]|uniref:SIR2-like domain-containing protein n=1 Tax=Sulfitobacter brevis TaxID=74348 RepID=A0A1I2FT24_9RHOB|nr:SIR2 family protein [Sulfitobacter brevis]SFF08594.1 SIR2-like domain-containing protein [Sulfitobacter brevis]